LKPSCPSSRVPFWTDESSLRGPHWWRSPQSAPRWRALPLLTPICDRRPELEPLRSAFDARYQRHFRRPGRWPLQTSALVAASRPRRAAFFSFILVFRWPTDLDDGDAADQLREPLLLFSRSVVRRRVSIFVRICFRAVRNRREAPPLRRWWCVPVDGDLAWPCPCRRILIDSA